MIRGVYISTCISLLIPLGVLFILADSPALGQEWQLVSSYDFENGKVPNLPGNPSNNENAKFEVVSTSRRSGNFCLKATAFGDNIKPRAQMVFDNGKKIPWTAETQERRYIFSVKATHPKNMIAQWYGVEGNRYEKAGPTITINDWDHLQIGRRREKSDHPHKFFDWIDLGSHSTEWVNMDVRVRWSNGRDGYIEIYRDGRQIARRNGPTVYDRNKTYYNIPIFEVGVYVGDWEGISEKSLYVDDVEIWVKGVAR